MQVCQFFVRDQISCWPSEELALKSFALSNLLLQKVYQNIIVFTDNSAAHFVSELLGIPTGNIRVLHDDIGKSRGSIAEKEIKLHVWNQVDHRFLLVDSDVYLWRRLDNHILENELFFLCADFGDRACFEEMVWVREKFEAANTLFTNLKINVDARSYFTTVNTKICGGNYQIYNNYTKSIQNLFAEEKQFSPAKYINAIERYFILGYLKQNGVEYSTILDFPLNYKSNVYSIFEDIGRKTGITWVPDELKGRGDIGRFLSLKLCELYPAHANIIDRYYKGNHSGHDSANMLTTQHFPRTKAAVLELACSAESQLSDNVGDFITMTDSLIQESGKNTELLADVFQYELTKFNRTHPTSLFGLQESSLYHYNLYTTVVEGNHQQFLAKRLRFNQEALVHRSRYNWAVYDQSIPELYTLKVLYNMCNEAENYFTLFTPSTTFLSMELKLNELETMLIDVFQQSESVIAGIEKVIERASVDQNDLQRTVGSLIETIKRFAFYGILLPD